MAQYANKTEEAILPQGKRKEESSFKNRFFFFY
jgi:hypothetical protein